MHGDNDRMMMDPFAKKTVLQQQNIAAPFVSPRNPPTHRSDALNDEPSHARGGHGIFGEPKVM